MNALERLGTMGVPVYVSCHLPPGHIRMMASTFGYPNGYLIMGEGTSVDDVLFALSTCSNADQLFLQSVGVRR